MSPRPLYAGAKTFDEFWYRQSEMSCDSLRVILGRPLTVIALSDARFMSTFVSSAGKSGFFKI